MVAPANGSLSTTHVSHGEHIVVFCDSDYTLYGEGVIFALQALYQEIKELAMVNVLIADQFLYHLFSRYLY